MAEADGEVAIRDPEELLKEIERTRENLARTIDTLTDRVRPANVVRRALMQAREQAARPEARLVGGIAVAAATVVVSYLLWRRRR